MTQSWRSWGWKFCSANILAIGGAIAFSGNSALAQITPDSTLGSENSKVTSTGSVDQIRGGATRGANLFHSFQEFNVDEGRAAYFTNPSGIENILSRVTGVNSSNILGTLGVSGGNANLFLINPNGIIFGSNARLDVGGSFVATTANAVRLGDTGLFSASEPATSNLLSVRPSAIFFNAVAAQEKEIVNQSQAQSLSGETNSLGGSVGLQVPTGQTLALVGGNVILEGGNLTVAGGRIELGSVAGVGEVSLSQTGNSWLIGYDETDTFGHIRLEGGLLVDASSEGGGGVQIQSAQLEMTQGASIFADTLGAGNGKEVLIRTTEGIALRDFSRVTADVLGSGDGGNLILDTGRLSVRDGARIQASTFGEGSAGILTVRASESIELIGTGAEADGQTTSGLFNSVNPGATGAGGNLILDTGRLIVRDGAQIGAGTFGEGSGGTLEVRASESIELIGTGAEAGGQIAIASGLFSSVNPGATGAGGNLILDTGRLIVRDGAQIGAGTFGEGSGGTLEVRASESIELIGTGTEADGRFPSGLSTSVGRRATGDGGNLTLDTGRLIVRDGAQVIAGTQGEGPGGTLVVRASESVKLIGESADGQFVSNLSTGTEGARDAGDLRIETGQLIVQDGAQIGAGTFGEGSGGTLAVEARESVELSGTSADGQSLSGLFTQVGSEATGAGGNLAIATGRLIVRDGAVVSASTLGMGTGGTLAITTGKLLVQDGAQVLADTSGDGQGGTLAVTAESVELIGTTADGNDNSILSVATSDTGDAGDLAITTGKLLVQDGAQVLAATFGDGQGGTLAVTAESVELIGTSPNARFLSGLFTGTQGAGAAGDLTIATGQLIVRDGAEVNVSSEETGNAGNLEIAARDLLLDKRGVLRATTDSGEGGNIELRVQDLLLIRRGSEISTTAGLAGAGGNGGNIDIDTNFLIALPSENSDITANAYEGNGGNINITTQGIFGLEFQEQRTPQSDITASSEFGVDGVVELNTPDVEPSQGLVSLPAVPIDTQVAQACTPGGSQATSEFVVTGRGGLPPNPNEALSSDAIQVDWFTLNPEVEDRSSQTVSTNPTTSEPATIVEAQGWVMDKNGEVLLTASAPTATPHSSWQTPVDCHGS